MKKIIFVLTAFCIIAAAFLIVGRNGKENTVPSSNATTTLKVFFNNSLMDPDVSCNLVFPTERTVSATQSPASTALALLLQGPTKEEKDAGYFTSINDGVGILGVSIKDGVAFADFDAKLEFQVGGSCRISAIRAQITETLKQFTSVENVIISIDGRTEDILQP